MAKTDLLKLERELRVVLEHVQDIHYGSVNLIFQDGKLVRIERTDKFKVENNESSRIAGNS
ncbi:MAG: YezD family protein [Clostridiales bacterium]|nr:YezD family protein [Clostridiales bacterium]